MEGDHSSFSLSHDILTTEFEPSKLKAAIARGGGDAAARGGGGGGAKRWAM